MRSYVITAIELKRLNKDPFMKAEFRKHFLSCLTRTNLGILELNDQIRIHS